MKRKYVVTSYENRNRHRFGNKSLLPVHWNNRMRHKFSEYSSKGNIKGLIFNISYAFFEDILKLPCNYCGSNKDITIDRIDSNKWYEENNVQPLCFICNRMKAGYCEKFFKYHLQKIKSFNNL